MNVSSTTLVFEGFHEHIVDDIVFFALPVYCLPMSLSHLRSLDNASLFCCVAPLLADCPLYLAFSFG